MSQESEQGPRAAADELWFSRLYLPGQDGFDEESYKQYERWVGETLGFRTAGNNKIDDRHENWLAREIRWLSRLHDPEAVNSPRYDFAQQMGSVLINATLEAAYAVAEERRLSEKLAYDELTGLLTGPEWKRRALEAMARAGETGDQLAILYMDMDHFKRVNDTLGHDRADQLLVVAGRVIRGQIRSEEGDLAARNGIIAPSLPEEETKMSPSDEAEPIEERQKEEGETARLHGDEYVVLLRFSAATLKAVPGRSAGQQLAAEQRTTSVAERIGRHVTNALRRAEPNIPGIGVSIGSVVIRPGMSLEKAIKEAEKAMYGVKYGKGRGKRWYSRIFHIFRG